jgi:hypothetical protein
MHSLKAFSRTLGTSTLVLFLLSLLAACSGGSSGSSGAMGVACSSGSGSSSSVTVNGDVAIAYVSRPIDSIGNPTEATRFTPGGDLCLREKSSPSSAVINVTGAQTQGQGDVSDPEVSYDGTKLLFSMRRAADPGWRIWEYDIPHKTLRGPIACTVATGTTPPGDDVDPAYLPNGRIVFVSNRQVASQAHMTEESVAPFPYLDEYERQRSTTLHVMDSTGQNCEQISANQSHDRNPTVLQSGKIMYSRWDHVGGRNQFTIFTTYPNGTELFVEYGAHSSVNSFLHPREMPNGKVISDAMPLSRTHEGGALMVIDIQNYSENDEPAPGVSAGGQGQTQATAQPVNYDRGISKYGRYSTPYPLWDGSNRALVSWTPSCAAVSDKNCQQVVNPLTGTPEPTEGTPTYSICMLNLGDGTCLPVATPPPGYALLDPVAIQPRPLPNIATGPTITPSLRDAKFPQLNTTGVGILDVQSVYDTDDKQRMGDAVLIAGVDPSIPKVTSIPSNPAANQCYVNKIGAADICKLKDPAQTTAAQRPARFMRVTRAVPTQQGTSREAIGETDFEMQQILGYVPIEPDGSFKVEVPADIPLGLTVVDSAGRGFQTHTSWIQVRPGETRTCHGCHSPRRDQAINVAPVAGYHNNVLTMMQNQTSPGDSMATTRERATSGASRKLQPDMSFTDVWTDPTAADVVAAASAGRRPSPAAKDPDLVVSYTGSTGLTTTAPGNGVINYEDHIAPLWAKYNCVSCHDGSANTTAGRHALNLSSTVGGAGRFVSYDTLLIGDPQLDAQGRPVLEAVDGQLRVVQNDAQVTPGFARSSHLIEVLFNQQLKSAYALGTTNHSTLLNMSAGEKRLVSEWIDLGAQYFNSPHDSSGALRGVTGMSASVFHTNDPTDRDIQTILLDRCGACHQPVGAVGAPAGTPNANFVGRRFVLTGDPEGDFNVTLSMVGNRSQPSTTELLRRPTSLGTNPTHGLTPTGTAILSTTEADYKSICSWISSSGPCP